MTRRSGITMLAALCLSLCSAPALQAQTTLSALLESESSPPSPGTGDATLTLDALMTQFDINIDWQNLVGTPTKLHIHDALTPGGNGPAIFDLSPFPATTTGSFSGTVLLSSNLQGYTPAKIADDFQNHLLYVNIHSSAYTGGEIRGQVVPEPGAAAAAIAMLLPAGMLLRRKRKSE